MLNNIDSLSVVVLGKNCWLQNVTLQLDIIPKDHKIW